MTIEVPASGVKPGAAAHVVVKPSLPRQTTLRAKILLDKLRRRPRGPARQRRFFAMATLANRARIFS